MRMEIMEWYSLVLHHKCLQQLQLLSLRLVLLNEKAAECKWWYVIHAGDAKSGLSHRRIEILPILLGELRCNVWCIKHSAFIPTNDEKLVVSKNCSHTTTNTMKVSCPGNKNFFANSRALHDAPRFNRTWCISVSEMQVPTPPSARSMIPAATFKLL